MHSACGVLHVSGNRPHSGNRWQQRHAAESRVRHLLDRRRPGLAWVDPPSDGRSGDDALGRQASFPIRYGPDAGALQSFAEYFYTVFVENMTKLSCSFG